VTQRLTQHSYVIKNVIIHFSYFYLFSSDNAMHYLLLLLSSSDVQDTLKKYLEDIR